MSNYFNYKGYSGSYEASFDDDCMQGRILFIEDLVTYEAKSFSLLETFFRKAVDEYLQHCEKMGKPAEKPYSGSFNRLLKKAHIFPLTHPPKKFFRSILNL